MMVVGLRLLALQWWSLWARRLAVMIDVIARAVRSLLRMRLSMRAIQAVARHRILSVDISVGRAIRMRLMVAATMIADIVVVNVVYIVQIGVTLLRMMLLLLLLLWMWLLLRVVVVVVYVVTSAACIYVHGVSMFTDIWVVYLVRK